MLTAYKQYCPAAGATQGNIAYTQTAVRNLTKNEIELNNLTKFDQFYLKVGSVALIKKSLFEF